MLSIGQVPRRSGSPHAVFFGWKSVGTGGIVVRSAGTCCAMAGTASAVAASSAPAVTLRMDFKRNHCALS